MAIQKPTGAAPAVAAENASQSLSKTTIWYPLAFVEDLDGGRPHSVSVHDEPLVLFRDEAGAWACFVDRCPHRHSKLSDGQLNSGKLECLYHGWQFDGLGKCTHIPQLDGDKEIPARAQLTAHPLVEKQGMLWVWLGQPGSEDANQIPSIPELDGDAVVSVDFMMDIPYEQSYLVENVLDVAHIHIAHHDMRGGGHREYAKPLEFEIDEVSVGGIKARFRTKGLEVPDAPALEMAHVELKGPNLVWYRSEYSDKSLVSGLALYALPLGAGRCRLLYRSFSNFWSSKELRQPRWHRHGDLCTILEQDMAVVVGQAAWIDSSKVQLRDSWLPIKSSDTLVVQYRKWLDTFCAELPNHRGFASAAITVRPNSPGVPHYTKPNQRFRQHTLICSACSDMWRRSERMAWGAMISMLVLLVAAVFLGGTNIGRALGLAALCAGMLALAAHRRRLRLERPTAGMGPPHQG
jgi:phenylpropionate dioxygenase-like ring-hydroxylating dioxygenase large terminal subunit